MKSTNCIKEGDFIYDGLRYGEVFKLYKSGVLVLYTWENLFGTFYENVFYYYKELLNDSYKLIN